jgi:hypothetical protein
MKIAIVGTAQSANDAPIGEEDWKIWSLPGNYERWNDIEKADHWFELHEIPYLVNDRKAKPEFMELLKKMGNKLTIIEPCSELPDAKIYPRQQMIDMFGAYFTSSIAWMVALAAASEADTIGVWGVNCSGTNEYAEQRAAIEGYLRYAQGRGKNLNIHPDSMLFKGFLYHDSTSQRITKKLRSVEKELERERDMANYKTGYVDALKFMKVGLGE